MTADKVEAHRVKPDRDLSANAMADRVNCYALGGWLDALSDKAGVPLHAPLGASRERVDIPLVTLGVTVTLFRHADRTFGEADQVVFHRIAFDPHRAILPFGLIGATLTPDLAAHLLSDDTAGGRTVDRARGDTRISHFLPEDARVVELTYNATMVGITACKVFRLGGEIPYDDVARRFGPSRLGI